MSTSLKNKYANDIVEAMMKKLNDESFTDLFHKEASLNKEGVGQYETMLIGDIKNLKGANYNEWVAIRNKWFGGGENQSALLAEMKKTYGEMHADEVYNKYNDQVDALEPSAAADDQKACAPKEMANDYEVVAAEFAIKHLIKIADTLDNRGFKDMAGLLDETIEKVAKKKGKKKGKYKTHEGKDEKPPEGAEKKAPKEWFDKMKKDVEKENPDYSAKRINEVVGDIWDNELSDKKRSEIVKRYKGEKKD